MSACPTAHSNTFTGPHLHGHGHGSENIFFFFIIAIISNVSHNKVHNTSSRLHSTFTACHHSQQSTQHTYSKPQAGVQRTISTWVNIIITIIRHHDHSSSRSFVITVTATSTRSYAVNTACVQHVTTVNMSSRTANHFNMGQHKHTAQK
jgi:hypothetical protein